MSHTVPWVLLQLATATAPVQESENAGKGIVVRGEVPTEQRQVCRKESVTGSKLERRVCRTVAQVDSDQRQAQETLQDIRRESDTQNYVQNVRNRR